MAAVADGPKAIMPSADTAEPLSQREGQVADGPGGRGPLAPPLSPRPDQMRSAPAQAPRTPSTPVQPVARTSSQGAAAPSPPGPPGLVDEMVLLFQSLSVADPASGHPDTVCDALRAKQAVLLELDTRTLALLRDHPTYDCSECRF